MSMTSIGPDDLSAPVVVTGCTICGREALRGEPIPHRPTCPAGQTDELRGILAAPTPRIVLEAQVAELRAVLAPPLDFPTRYAGRCIFCGVRAAMGGVLHEPDCPVLRKDALLGR